MTVTCGRQERVLSSIRPVTDHWEVLFARAEGLHAHGFTGDACRIGVTLAQQLLSNPPDLTVEPAAPQAKTKKRRGVNPVTHQVSGRSGKGQAGRGEVG